MTTATKTYLVTGANSGLGLEAVRQLAVRPDTSKIYMACRTKEKALAAIDSLVDSQGIKRELLNYAHFDASGSVDDIVADAASLGGVSLDGVILNAGGMGHDTKGLPTGPNKVLDIYQINVIGNIQLLEALSKAGILARGCRVIYSGSEGARGVPIMGIRNPKLQSTSSWYEKQLKGTTKGLQNMQVYAMSKGFAALYLSAWARRHPQYHVLTVSPGGTTGTEIFSSGAMPSMFKGLIPIMLPMMSAMGVMHAVEDGAKRYVDAVTGDGSMANFASGTFVASHSGTTGKVSDQAKSRAGKQYGNRAKQEAAFACFSVFAEQVDKRLGDNNAEVEA